MNNDTSLTGLNQYIRKYWKSQAIVIFLGILSGLLGSLSPYLSKLVIDKAYINKDLKLFFILFVIGAVIVVLSGILNSLKDYLSKCINTKVNFEIVRDLFVHFQNLPLGSLNDQSTGEHMYKISSDAGAVTLFVCNTIPEMAKLCPQLLFTLGIVFFLNWKLALLAVLLVPLSLLQPYYFGRWIKKITHKMIEKSEGIFKELEEVFSHRLLVKAMGKERREANHFEEAFSKKINFELEVAKVASISGFSSSALNKLIGGIITLYGGYLVIKGAMTLGSLTAIMIYLGQLVGLMYSISSLYESMIISAVSRERIAMILNKKLQIKDGPQATDYIIRQGGIEFKNVLFGYKKDEFLLKDLSFSIKPASKVALVGPSGCGKTTLFSMFLKLYALQAGGIFIDGIDLKDMKDESLRKQIGIVLQEPFLWNASVKDNILYAKENASVEEVIGSARIAEAHGFIQQLPQGYDTVIGEGACKISDGQKQRIAIARAVINKPKILLLDEATSSLDSETENKIIENVKREFSDSTVIIVSHRLSAAQKMESVCFFENSSEMTTGTHDALIKNNKKYKEFFASQTEKLVQTS